MTTAFSVRSVEFPNLSGPVAQTTLFTPEETGLFRVTPYFEETVNEETPGVNVVQYYWVDGGGDQSFNLAQAPASPNPSSQIFDSVLIRAIGGNAVQVLLGVSGTNTFNAYFVIEKLG